MYVWGVPVHTGLLLDQIFSASNQSLAGTGITLPNGGLLYAKHNPAQLIFTHDIELATKFDQGPFVNRYFGLLGSKRFYNYPVGFLLDLHIPYIFEEIDNEGFIIGANSIYSIQIGLMSAKSFRFKKYQWHLGIGLNLYYSRLFTFDTFSFAFNIGALFPVTIPILTQYTNYIGDILLISLSFTNLGLPLTYLNTKNNLPYATQIGLSWQALSLNLHTLTLLTNIKFYFTKSELSDNFIYSSGVEYKFFNLVFIRGGLSRDYQRTDFNMGCGIQYMDNDLYSIQIDYNFHPGGELDHGHQVNLKITFLYDNFKDKFKRSTRAHERELQKIYQQVIDKLEKYILDYKLSHGHFPHNLQELINYIQSHDAKETLPENILEMVEYHTETGKINFK